MFVSPVVEHTAGIRVVRSRDFQHFLVVTEVVLELSFDGYRAGDGAVVGIPQMDRPSSTVSDIEVTSGSKLR